MSKKITETYLKDVERFKKQQARFEKITTAYNTYSKNYYGKAKRQNLLHNEERILKTDPYSLSHKELKQRLKENASTIRELGFNSKMSGDIASASVLVELNNEAYDSVNWLDSEGVDTSYELLEKQQQVMAEYLIDSLLNLRLTDYQLDRVLERSILPDEEILFVKIVLKDYWKGKRK